MTTKHPKTTLWSAALLALIVAAFLPALSRVLTEADADAIHAYLVDQAWQIYKEP